MTDFIYPSVSKPARWRWTSTVIVIGVIGVIAIGLWPRGAAR